MPPRWLCCLFVLSALSAVPAAAQYPQIANSLPGPTMGVWTGEIATDAVPGTSQSHRDEVWLVSSRRMNSRQLPADSLDVWKRVGQQWVNSSVNEFRRADPNGFQRPVVIMVHGNSWSFSKAIQRGLETYQDTIVPWRDRVPMRFVIWTWPSDKIPGPIRNARVKAIRADEHSIHLARFVKEMTAHPRISMLGYSYGARVTLGALDLLGGGCVRGSRILNTPMPIPRINLSLIAPAVRNDALMTSRGEAYRMINHLFVMYNSRDQYLKYYRFARFDGNTPALGFTGVAGKSQMPHSTHRIDQFDASQQVGVQHDYLEYLRNGEIEKRLRRNLMYEPLLR